MESTESKYPDVSASWTEMHNFYKDVYNIIEKTPLIELLDDQEFQYRVLQTISAPSALYTLIQDKLHEEVHSNLSFRQIVLKWGSYVSTLVWNEDSPRTNNPVNNGTFTKGQFVDLLALEPFLKAVLRHADPTTLPNATDTPPRRYNVRPRFMLKANSHTAIIQYDGENDAWTYSVSRLSGGNLGTKFFTAGSYAEALDLIEITIRLTHINQKVAKVSDIVTQLHEVGANIANNTDILSRLESEGEANPVFKELVESIKGLGVLYTKRNLGF